MRIQRLLVEKLTLAYWLLRRLLELLFLLWPLGATEGGGDPVVAARKRPRFAGPFQ